MRSTRFSIPFRLWLGASVLCFATSGHGLDVHLQHLPVAPGLMPSAALDPLEGVREAVNCGLDFLDTAKHCGLAAPAETASPFLVRFDPLFCRLTMRFAIGELIDGLLGHWIAGAFARIGSPVVGALCLLGIGPHSCGASERAAPAGAGTARFVAPATAEHQRAVREALKAAREAPGGRETAPQSPSPSPSPPETNRHDATGLDHLTR
jgi:hypothetical protein